MEKDTTPLLPLNTEQPGRLKMLVTFRLSAQSLRLSRFNLSQKVSYSLFTPTGSIGSDWISIKYYASCNNRQMILVKIYLTSLKLSHKYSWRKFARTIMQTNVKESLCILSSVSGQIYNSPHFR